jgi:hypothetical protein
MITGAVIVVAALVDIQRRQMTEAVPSSRHTSAPIATPVQEVPRSKTLDQALKQFTQALEGRFQVDAITVYLRQRETNELVKPDGERCAESQLAHHVYLTGRSMTIPDVRRPQDMTISQLKPESRVAAAVPIRRDGRHVIGVVELQSATPNALNMLELESIMMLCGQLSGAVEDNWLLEIGWLTRQIRDSLRNLADDAYLEKSELGEWLFWETAQRGDALRKLLTEAIDYLHSETVDANSRAQRRYQILRQTYVDQKHVDGIIRDLGLSRRQYFYDLKEGIDAVTHYIFTQHQMKGVVPAQPMV